MPIQRQEVVAYIRPLLQLARQAEAYMASAVANIADVSRKTKLIQEWQQHAQIVEELSERLSRFGGKAEAVVVALKPGRRSKETESETRISQEIIKLEASLLSAYQENISRNLPVDVRRLLEGHMDVFRDISRQAACAQAQPDDLSSEAKAS